MEHLRIAPQIDPARSLAELVRSLPGAARTFEQLGIDYCCRGMQSLREAVAQSPLALDEVVARLHLADEATVPIPSAPAELCQYVVQRHHKFTREALERLTPLADRVLLVHGMAQPNLQRVQQLIDLLTDDLLPHMLKEERVLFPYITALAAGQAPNAPFGTIDNPLRMMHLEHDHVGALLRALSALTGGYRAPAGACASYTALYAGLEELQSDLHQHIHLENNVLFPLGRELEQRLGVR